MYNDGVAEVEDVAKNVVTSAEMRDLKGMTAGRLRHWVRDGYLKPTLMKGNYVFSTQERDIARVMLAMVEAGLSAEAAAKAARDNGWINDTVRVVIGSRSKQKFWRSVQSLSS